MKNIEKYKDIVLEDLNNCHLESRLRMLYGKEVVNCLEIHCGECKERFLKWLLEECKEPILDEVEREYLKAVIRPFRNKIDTISKFNTFDDRQYIYIGMKDRRWSNLPCFPKGTMYKGMEDGKHYSPKELGL
jgi:hypothetical protein